MDLSIFSGYLYEKSYPNLWGELIDLKPKLHQMIRDHYIKEAVHAVYFLYDAIQLEKNEGRFITSLKDRLPVGKYTIGSAIIKFADMCYTSSAVEETFDFNLFTKIYIFPLKGKCLLILSGSPIVEHFFFTNGFAQYYGYWRTEVNLDQDLYDEEWIQRGCDWQKVFFSKYVTNKSGLEFQLSPDRVDIDLFSNQLLLESLKPRLELRFRQAALDECLKEDFNTVQGSKIAWGLEKIRKEGRDLYSQIQSEFNNKVGDDLPFQDILKKEIEIY